MNVSIRSNSFLILFILAIICIYTTQIPAQSIVNGVIAKASNSYSSDRLPCNLLNADGMDLTETYFYNLDGSETGEPTSANNVEWVTINPDLANAIDQDKVWVVFDLGAVRQITQMDIWNWQWNHSTIGDLSDRGMKQFDVYIRFTEADTDDGTISGTPINVGQVSGTFSTVTAFNSGTSNPWQLLLENQTLPQAPDTDAHIATSYDLANTTARFVAIKADDWHSGNGCGMGKVRFYAQTPESTQGVIIIESNEETVVSEDGQTDTYEIMLNSEPTNSVYIVMEEIDNSDYITFDPNELLFSPSNWSEPQIVTIGAIDDQISDNTETHLISVRHTTVSSDEHYQTLEDIFLPIWIKDNDCGSWGYLKADVNYDCQVDILDLILIITEWLETDE